MTPEQQDRVARARAEFVEEQIHTMLGLSWRLWAAGKANETAFAQIWMDRTREVLGRAFDAAYEHIREHAKPGQQPQNGKRP